MKKWLWIIGFGLVLLFAIGSYEQLLEKAKPKLMLSLPDTAPTVGQQPPPAPAGKKRGKAIEELGGKR